MMMIFSQKVSVQQMKQIIEINIESCLLFEFQFRETERLSAIFMGVIIPAVAGCFVCIVFVCSIR